MSAHRSVPKSRQTGGREARLDPVLARVWGGSCNAAREQQNRPLCACLLRFNGSAPVWRCWCGMNPPQPLPINQDWSGGTDYLCKNNMKGVSTSPPLSLNASMSSPYIQVLPSCLYFSKNKIAVLIMAYRHSVTQKVTVDKMASLCYDGRGNYLSAVLSEPHLFCNKKQTPCIHTFWPVHIGPHHVRYKSSELKNLNSNSVWTVFDRTEL